MSNSIPILSSMIFLSLVIFHFVLREKLMENGFIITSGFRTPWKNKSVGGAKMSRHMLGMAFDIKDSWGRSHDEIVKVLKASGFRQIIFEGNHYHVAAL